MEEELKPNELRVIFNTERHSIWIECPKFHKDYPYISERTKDLEKISKQLSKTDLSNFSQTYMSSQIIESFCYLLTKTISETDLYFEDYNISKQIIPSP